MTDKELAGLIKQAMSLSSVKDGAKALGGAIKSDAGKLGGQFEQVGLAAKGKGIHGSNLHKFKGVAESMKPIIKNKAIQAGGAAVAAVGAGGYAMGREKKASEMTDLELAVMIKEAMDNA